MRVAAFSWLLAVPTLLIPQLLAQAASDAVRLKPGDDVVAVVKSHPAGTTFVFAPGVYRMQAIVPKANDVFEAEGHATLDGAQLLDMHPDGAVWSAVAERAKWGPGHCSATHPLCWSLNDLFIDDVYQTPVDSVASLAPGKWFYDEVSAKAVVGTNPAGRNVEFGKISYAFSGTAEGVKIIGLKIEKYASPPQRGAIGAGDNPPGWELSKLEIAWNHGVGVELGQHALVHDCNIHHNGQMGIGVHGPDDLLEHNEIAFNNYAGYKTGWEAGGSKFSRTDRLIVRSNYAHDNDGAGLWADIDNIHTLYENNIVANNTGTGIAHEISYDAIIRNNILRNNKPAVLAGESSNVEIYGNLIQVAQKDQGIMLRHMEHRGLGAYGPRTAHGNHVHDNVTVYLGDQGVSGLGTEGLDAEGEAGASTLGPDGKPLHETTAGDNLYDHNEYYLPAGGDRHWTWNGPKTMEEMHALGQEADSKVYHSAPNIPRLAATGIPAQR